MIETIIIQKTKINAWYFNSMLKRIVKYKENIIALKMPTVPHIQQTAFSVCGFLKSLRNPIRNDIKIDTHPIVVIITLKFEKYDAKI